MNKLSEHDQAYEQAKQDALQRIEGLNRSQMLQLQAEVREQGRGALASMSHGRIALLELLNERLK